MKRCRSLLLIACAIMLCISVFSSCSAEPEKTALKVLRIDIDNVEFDCVAAGNEIEQYCLKNDIPAHSKYRIRLAIEDVVQQQLLPHGDCFPIHIGVEYSAADRMSTVSISYGGEGFDPANGDNKLSYDLIKHTVKDLKYDYDPERAPANTITAVIAEQNQ